MHHIFIDENLINDNIININILEDKENFNHLYSSLRLKINEKVRISIENIDFDYMTITKSIDKNNIALEIIDKIPKNELDTIINLYQGIPKSGILEDIIDKSVELGVYSITPMISKNSISKISIDKEEKKLNRFNKISKSASEQSIRGIIPKVNNVKYFNDIIKNISNDKYNFLFYENEKDFNKTKNIFNELKQDKNTNKQVNIIIGPEGGFDIEEINYAKQNNVNLLSLGNRILRVETATLTALSYLNYILEGEYK